MPGEGEGEKSGTKLNMRPSSNTGMCVCPICGTAHAPGQGHSHANQFELPSAAVAGGSKAPGVGSSSVLDEGAVSETIGKIHENISKIISERTFSNNFIPNFSNVQKGVAENMKKIDKREK